MSQFQRFRRRLVGLGKHAWSFDVEALAAGVLIGPARRPLGTLAFVRSSLRVAGAEVSAALGPAAVPYR